MVRKKGEIPCCDKPSYSLELNPEERRLSLDTVLMEKRAIVYEAPKTDALNVEAVPYARSEEKINHFKQGRYRIFRYLGSITRLPPPDMQEIDLLLLDTTRGSRVRNIVGHGIHKFDSHVIAWSQYCQYSETKHDSVSDNNLGPIRKPAFLEKTHTHGRYHRE